MFEKLKMTVIDPCKSLVMAVATCLQAKCGVGMVGDSASDGVYSRATSKYPQSASTAAILSMPIIMLCTQ
ncbi:hypothetical protein CCHR01_19501 [Colletotrichum chrysophilum]|uniref:Uncharacterized protein n=1 Tax=Colletotrichum chrysophilum TaxID=1836956 RepID=A0AAD8ZY60_9PEZI|nr:hypothetical protein CCHR01_19501 [Colletotrichum chrysophilum]